MSFFIYFDGKKICASSKFIGKSDYKSFNKFINRTLSANLVSPKKIWVPKNYISKRTQEIWGYQNIEFILYSNYAKNVPELLRLIRTNIKNLYLSNPFNELNNIVKSVNTMINPLMLSTQSLNGAMEIVNNSNKTIKRMYSTLVSAQKFSSEGRAKWKSFKTENFSILDNSQIENFVTSFWNEVVVPETTGNTTLKIAIQLRVQLNNLGIRSLSFVDVIGINDKAKVISAFQFVLSKKFDVYHEEDIQNLIIVYKTVGKSTISKISTPTLETELKKTGYNPKTLDRIIPATMDIKAWGPGIQNPITKIWTIQLNSKVYAEVTIKNKMNFVTVYEKRLIGSLKLFSFMDKLRVINQKIDYGTFDRIFNDNSIYFIKGVVKLNVEDIKCKYIDEIKPHKEPNNKVITMDLETREINGQLDPVCVSIYDGKIKKTLWIEDFSSSYTMLVAAFNYLLVRKYYGHKLYLHNFSYFDGVFLLKVLAEMTNINLTNVLIRDGRILKLVIQFNKAKNKTKSGAEYQGSITIYDSLLILPASLDKLSKVFKCESKGMFPLKFINSQNTPLSYIGVVPDIKHFYHPDPVTQREAYEVWTTKYNKYILSFTENNWNLKQELIKYCEQDVVSLRMVILTFTHEIYSKFKVNILDYPTLSSIAFAIYRLKFIKPEVIPILTGGIYNDIKKGYYGGFVDVYQVLAQNVQGFDVNSLYPSSMEKFPVPVGKPEFFEGDYKMKFKNLFGFVLVRVVAPSIERPILPFKIINENGSQSTIYPTGTWTGWYFTEEIRNAMKYGYKFTIIKGYHFDSQIIFSNYINELYAIKCSVSPDNPWYTISKLLQNSLYGRFGMSPDMDKNEFMDHDSYDNLLRLGDKCVKDHLELGNKTLVTYLDSQGEHNPNVSVAVAAAISSWSRIQMTHYIMKYGDSICYIDTDGIKTTSSIDPCEVGTKLGMMKYEGTFKEAVFIAPKVYGGISENLEMTVKVKGLKNPITYWKLKLLLYMDKLEISQDKWVREWNKGSISILNQIYTLSATENKRHIIWDSCGKIVDTRPFELLNGLKVTPDTYMLYYFPILLEHKLLQAPQSIDLNLRLSGPNIIYLPEPLPAVIYLSSPLADIIYLSDPVLNRLAAPYLVPIMFRLSVPHMPLSLPSPCQSEISIKSIPIKSITVKVSVSDNIDNTITIHPSIRAAARSIKISDSTIRRYLKSDRKTFVKGRYSFNYIS